jgi:hypothetical protein
LLPDPSEAWRSADGGKLAVELSSRGGDGWLSSVEVSCWSCDTVPSSREVRPLIRVGTDVPDSLPCKGFQQESAPPCPAGGRS